MTKNRCRGTPGILFQRSESIRGAHPRGGVWAGAVPEDAGRVRLAVASINSTGIPQGVRRGVQADAEERADGENRGSGQGAGRLRVCDAEGGRAVGEEAGGREPGGTRRKGVAGVPRLRLPHVGGAGGGEREGTQYGAEAGGARAGGRPADDGPDGAVLRRRLCRQPPSAEPHGAD